MNMRMVCGMFVWCSLCVSLCMFTVSNALLMSSAIAMVLFMLCSDVLVKWLLLKPCCVEMCGILFVMYGISIVFSVSHH